jgi:hypothetical protein
MPTMHSLDHHQRRAATLYAHAHRSDPTAYGRIVLHLAVGIARADDVIEEAQRMLGQKR